VLPFAPVPPILVRGVGFEAPDSVLYDARADLYLVSNVNGEQGASDGNGFISRLASDGTLVSLKWIDGASAGTRLDAPKGMALVGDKLFVADLGVLRSFDRNTGLATGEVAIGVASLLTDLSAGPAGVLYVADSGVRPNPAASQRKKSSLAALYRWDGSGAPSVLFRGPELGHPTGLFADSDGVWFVNLEGQLCRISPEGQHELVATLPGAGLDGLVQTEDGRWIVSSWEASSVFVQGPSPVPGLTFVPLITELPSPAGLGYDTKRRQVLVPQPGDGAVYIQQLAGR
jgi:hypothetical protein